jgi:hypothetical protein
LTGPFLCGLYTNGIGRELGGNPRTLLDELGKLQSGGAENPAEQYIQQAVVERPRDFADNLTLAVIRAE